jgi:tryptophan synthase alpha chain
VVSPGVPAERLQTLARDASGFVYCTSRQGITGATSKFSKDLTDFVSELKATFNLPIAVGFGVKSRADVEAISQFANIVIAGSVFVDAIKKNQDIERLSAALTA